MAGITKVQKNPNSIPQHHQYSVYFLLSICSLSFQSNALVPGHCPAKDQQWELGLQYRWWLWGEPRPAALLHQNHCAWYTRSLWRAPQVSCPFDYHQHDVMNSCILPSLLLHIYWRAGVLCRCGDEIVAVNGATTVGMNNSSLIPMLKLQKNKVTLTVVSWPGSLV